MILVTSVIYATGWGPALGIGLVLVGQDTLAVTGSSSDRVVLGWTLACLAAGEGLIALRWVPSLLPIPEVHGLAILTGDRHRVLVPVFAFGPDRPGAVSRLDRESRDGGSGRSCRAPQTWSSWST